MNVSRSQLARSFLSHLGRLAVRRCNDVVLDDRILVGRGPVWRTCATTTAVEARGTCTGCGSVLQSVKVEEVGYVPDVNRDAAKILCRRCFDLKHYNKSVKVNLTSGEYKSHLLHLRERKPLVLCMVDVVDFPSSLFPGLNELVNPDSVVFVVANKVDLLPEADLVRLNKLESYIRSEAARAGLTRIAKVMFTSAKHDTGIDELTREIVLQSRDKKDVYLLGCTNVGKSSLFHKLLVALCGIKPGLCGDNPLLSLNPLVSRMPGTTLGLIKGPIMKMRDRLQLLRNARQSGLIENREQMSLPKELVEALSGNSFDMSASSWLYDTPGAKNDAQVIHYLTNRELTLFLPKKSLKPRTTILKPGQTLFIGGLARLDYLEGPVSIYFTVFTTTGIIPLHVTRTDKADDLYKRNKGQPLLLLPFGDKERDPPYPPLSPHTVKIRGASWKYSVADVMLSTVGWVAVTAGKGVDVTLNAHLPTGCKVFTREPSLYNKAINERGPRWKKPDKRAFFRGKKSLKCKK